MAHKEQDWKDALQAAKSEGRRFDDNADEREKKKEARVMYAKRLLYKEIVRIHRKHGIYVT